MARFFDRFKQKNKKFITFDYDNDKSLPTLTKKSTKKENNIDINNDEKLKNCIIIIRCYNAKKLLIRMKLIYLRMKLETSSSSHEINNELKLNDTNMLSGELPRSETENDTNLLSGELPRSETENDINLLIQNVNKLIKYVNSNISRFSYSNKKNIINKIKNIEDAIEIKILLRKIFLKRIFSKDVYDTDIWFIKDINLNNKTYKIYCNKTKTTKFISCEKLCIFTKNKHNIDIHDNTCDPNAKYKTAAPSNDTNAKSINTAAPSIDTDYDWELYQYKYVD